MGILLNSGNTEFEEAVNAEIYVDKTLLIEYANRVLRTPQKYICVSRPRRFGKSMAANMLTAYYSKGCDSRELFSPYKISESDSFEKHINKYNVIHINMVEFLTDNDSIKDMLNELKRAVCSSSDNFPQIGHKLRFIKLPFADKDKENNQRV